jgi:hypoxanthine phosphoribosyltransferase
MVPIASQRASTDSRYKSHLKILCKKSTRKIIEKLGPSIAGLEQPIYLLAVCTGGRVVAKIIYAYLKKKGLDCGYYEVWTNTMRGKRVLWKSEFKKEKYQGSAVIMDDVIWSGGALPPIKKMLRKLNPHKRPYVASLLDCGRKADFSVFN